VVLPVCDLIDNIMFNLMANGDMDGERLTLVNDEVKPFVEALSNLLAKVKQPGEEPEGCGKEHFEFET